MLLRKTPPWFAGIARARAGSRTRLGWPDPRVGALIDTYADWHDECEAVRKAYVRWTRSDRGVRARAYAAYRAALDREERAAAVYELAVTQLVGVRYEVTECCVAGEHGMD